MNQQPVKTRYRWFVVGLLFFATTINYLDRQVLGLLKPYLEKDFNWSEVDYSYIVMAFTASYALGLLLFGRFIDKIGTKLGYALSIIVWSFAAMGHALAKSTGGFVVARATLGIGESGNFPAAIKAVAEWFPKKERAFATGIFNSGANIGAVVAPIMVPWIVGVYGWQEAFIITGALGFIWLIFWWIFYEIPTRSKRVNKAEIDHIHSDVEDQVVTDTPPTKISWGKLFKIRQTWVFVVGKFLTDPIWYFFLFWLPDYFSGSFNIDLSKPSLPLAIIFSATTVGSIGGGWLSGYFIKRGLPVSRARKTAMFIFALCVIPIFSAQFASNIWVVVGLISLAAAAHQAWSANIYTLVSDYFPKNAISSVIGIGGMAGSVGGIMFPFFIGHILDYFKLLGNKEAGYHVIFIICAIAYMLAWIIMHFINSKNTGGKTTPGGQLAIN